MTDELRSWLRTVVPAAWSTVVAYVAAAGAPEWLTSALGDAGSVVVVPLVLALVYAALRTVEPHLPAWARRVLLGSSRAPNYTR